MKLDLSKDIDIKKFKTYSEKLLEKKSKVELTELREKRTLQQNSYLHVCISLFAIEFGYTLDEAKTLLKRECPFMRYEKNGILFLKRTRDFDTKELTDFIDWIREYSGLNGCYIPKPDEYLSNRFEIEKEIEKHNRFL